jgi:Ribbon-helix-helix protein, copG family
MRLAVPSHHDAGMAKCYDATTVSKVRTTLTIDESVMKAVKMRAARTGRGDSQVIEESLRRDMGLDLLERLWERNDVPERDAEALAVEAQHRTRPRRR